MINVDIFRTEQKTGNQLINTIRASYNNLYTELKNMRDAKLSYQDAFLKTISDKTSSEINDILINKDIIISNFYRLEEFLETSCLYSEKMVNI